MLIWVLGVVQLLKRVVVRDIFVSMKWHKIGMNFTFPYML